MSDKKKESIYEEYFVNANYVSKLYEFYIKKTVYDKVIDILVFLAILFTVTGVILQYFIKIETVVLYFINSLSTVILFVFAIELVRDFARSKNNQRFFRNHWIDIFLVVFLSMYFLLTFFGLNTWKFLTFLWGYVVEAKYARVFFKLFRR